VLDIVLQTAARFVLVELSGIKPLTSSLRNSWNTKPQQLSEANKSEKQRETTRRNANWTLIGPTVGPTLAHAIDNAARTATSGVRYWLRICGKWIAKTALSYWNAT
jgi:hypothetical protein